MEEVLHRMHVGREEALEVARLKAETIYFAATHALSQTFFPDWIRKAQVEGADAAVQLVAANFAGCEKLLIEARVHFLLTHYHPSLGSRLDKDRFQHLELGKDVLVPVTAPSSGKAVHRRGRLSHGEPRYALPGSAEAPLPYLAYHPGSGIGRIVAAFLAGKDPACWLVPSFSAPVMLLIDMAREGRGVTWAPLSLVMDDLSSGRLMRAGGEEWDIEIGICLFRSRARITNAAEAFWNAIRKGPSEEPTRSALSPSRRPQRIRKPQRGAG
jgi:DNA-binding transcriptional LysR family regulator